MPPPWLSSFSCLLLWKLFRREIHDSSTIGSLFLLERPNNRPKIIAVFGCDPGSNLAHFVDYCVFRHGYGSISSSGVQMIGARKPALWHVSSILPRTAAFAI